MTGRAPDLTLRSLIPSVFLPVLVYEIGNGAIAPVIALTALRLGASTALAGLVLTLLGAGQIIGNVPSSFLVDRFGDRRAMTAAAGVAATALTVCFLAPWLPLFALAVTVIGMCNATYYLGRQSYIIQTVPPGMRAVALSTTGGSHRIGLFLGPLVGAAAIHLFSMRAAYLVAAAAATAAALILAVVADVDAPDGRAPSAAPKPPLRAVLASHRRLFLTLGLAVVAVGAARSARATVIPLWADHIGLSATTTSVVFGLATAVDMTLFYPAGRVMDRYGRLAVAVPSMVILGGATAALPLTHGAASLALAAIAMSFGNGLGSGIIMTLGADVAPDEARVRFLSVWRSMSDVGTATGPLVLASLAAAWTLAAGVTALGGVGLLAALALWRWVPLYSAFANRRMAQAARSSVLPRPGAQAGVERRHEAVE